MKIETIEKLSEINADIQQIIDQHYANPDFPDLIKLLADLKRIKVEICELSDLISAIEHPIEAQFEQLLGQAHLIIHSLLNNYFSFPVGLKAIKLFENNQSSYVPRNKAKEATSTPLFGDSLLSILLFGNKKNFKHYNSSDIINSKEVAVIIKQLINNGGDIVYAANTLLANEHYHEEGILSPYNKFNERLGGFFPTISTEARAHLNALGVEYGPYSRSLVCKLSRKFPTIPVKYKGTLYDLYCIAQAMRAKEKRQTPYEFTLNGKDIDTHEIQFYPQFFSKVRWLIEPRINHRLFLDKSCTLLYFNCKYMVAHLVVALFYQLLENATENKVCNLTPIRQQNSLIHAFMTFDMLLSFVLFFLSKVISSQEKNHDNYYIKSLFNFNFGYVAVNIVMSFIYAIAVYNKFNVPLFMSMDYEHRDVQNISLRLYTLAFSIFTALALSKARTFPTTKLYLEADIPVASPVFQKYIPTPRKEQRREILLNFNRLVKTKKAPASLLTSFSTERNESPKIFVEKILDMNFGEEFCRFRYSPH